MNTKKGDIAGETLTTFVLFLYSLLSVVISVKIIIKSSKGKPLCANFRTACRGECMWENWGGEKYFTFNGQPMLRRKENE